MLEIIISLLLGLGISFSPKSGSKPVIVIDQATGISYGVGTTNGVGTCDGYHADVYYLIQDPLTGKYRLVKR